MDKKKIQGKTDEVIGNIKEGAGDLTGNRDLEAEGMDQQTRGKVRETLGNIREGAKGALDKAKDKLDGLDRK